jgi:hypothetical protein
VNNLVSQCAKMLLLMPGCEHLTGQGTRTGRKGSECIQGGERISAAGNAYQERTRLHITVLKIRMRTEVASHTRTGNAYHIGHVYWTWNYAGVVSVRFIVSFFQNWWSPKMYGKTHSPAPWHKTHTIAFRFNFSIFAYINIRYWKTSLQGLRATCAGCVHESLHHRL